MKNRIIIGALSLIAGIFVGAFGNLYYYVPLTDELDATIETSYSYDNGELNNVQLTGEAGELSIHFLELGNKYTGDCTYIKIGDVDILIDCGSKSSSISTVSSYLNQYVTDKTFEYVIVTHAHTDHYAGFAGTSKVKGIFELYTCNIVIDFGNATNQTAGTTYNNYITKRNNSGATVYSALECCNNPNLSSFEISENVGFNILYNEHYQYDCTNATATKLYKAEGENDYSVCIMFYYGEKYFLFTGDLEADAEKFLVENNAIFNSLKNNGKQYGVELYKAGHHGSKTSSSEELLECVKPRVVCVCCCAGSPEYTTVNENQFPTQKFVDNISKYTTQIFVTTLYVENSDDSKKKFTSMNGNIVIVITENTFGVNCSNNNTVLKDTEWFAAHRTWGNA